MNVLIGIIILAAFLQTSFIGINLVLLFLVARSFIVETKANYYLAFFAGILVGILSAQNVGYWPLLFLLSVKIAHLCRRIPFNMGIITMLLPLSITILLSILAEKFIFHQTINWWIKAIEVIVAIPIYLFLTFWEDRFMVHTTSNVKLKLRK